MALSQGDTSNLSKKYPAIIQGDNNQMDNRITDFETSYEYNPAFPQDRSGQCIAHNN